MTWALFFLAALLAEVAGTVGGFGSSVFFVPVAQWLLPVKAALGVTGAFHVFSNLAKLGLFRQGINWRLVLLVGGPSVALVVVGAYLSNHITGSLIQLLLGIFLIGFALLFLLKPAIRLPPTPTNAVAGGGLAGFLAGLTGTGGAVRGLTLAAFNLEKNAFVATSAAIDMAVDLSRTVVYVQQGYLQREYWPYVTGLVVVAFVGSWLGKQILSRLSQHAFRRGVLALLLGIGLFTIWAALRRG
ncbi:sulfite exporter TauE/SafE family protein [Hymenobacter rigui]|uniref:Probable membrane transporter protein n=1 Tax=Hymenobacter rigui TaxID=334424 RepID=A0A3R9NJT7_9BACT|nr:sulfite exporter TauE/SafE family protein [Hymenobacter rigui]RSK48732.1 sulfite exporter TauE/SafE family protein [Hymenobacter rigui]